MIWLRSALFNLSFFVTTGVMAVLALPALLLPRAVTLRVMRVYARMVTWQMALILRLRVRVLGMERMPPGAVIIASKHQSAFDTIFWLGQVPAACYVLKQELLRLPVWGWHARRAGMIGVDRKAGARALRDMVRQARLRAGEGRQLVIYPEGTRTAPGTCLPYQPGVAALAAATALPVVPVATNSGVFWGRRAFSKHPGVITVSILPPLPAGLPRAALMSQLERSIEAESGRLVREAQAGRPGAAPGPA